MRALYVLRLWKLFPITRNLAMSHCTFSAIPLVLSYVIIYLKRTLLFPDKIIFKGNDSIITLINVN